MIATEDYLPYQILEMVERLHQSGYTNLYLYSGLSPSGFHWRFTIGYLVNGTWPTNRTIVYNSLSAEGSLEWCATPATVQELTENFISYFKPVKPEANTGSKKYVDWFAGLRRMLQPDELLVFYADFEAPHGYLLKFAPGFLGKGRH